jgi:3-oxoacyl-[acyl-carrier-protein] synthase-1
VSADIVHVVGLGASTPLGRDPWSSAAAVRAGITGFTQHPYLIDKAGQPLRVALALWLDHDISHSQRLEALLFPAIDQCLQLYRPNATDMRIAFAFALPSQRPGLAADLPTTLPAAINQRYRGVFVATAVFPHGHAAGLLALEAAQRRLADGTFDACVVAGVDSYMEPDTLEWLEHCDQLHGAGPFNNAWGFVPGEGAGALLLIRDGIAHQFHDNLLAQLLGIGTAVEANRIKTQTVCTGIGLTQAFRAALRFLPSGDRITDVYCDMNGEPYRADEYGFTCVRTKEHFEAVSDFIAPADCWGDVCAASAPLSVALAVIAGSKGYANGRTACVWASSEDGHRGAAVLRVRLGDAHAR